jgi:hypothetical protein
MVLLPLAKWKVESFGSGGEPKIQEDKGRL